MRTTLALLCLALTLACGGCASSKLSVKVDLFDTDPRVREVMSPAEASRHINELNSLRQEARAQMELRQALTEQSTALFIDYWTMLHGRSKRVGDLQKTSGRYLEANQRKLVEFSSKIETAVEMLQAYADAYSSVGNVAIKDVASRSAGCLPVAVGAAGEGCRGHLTVEDDFIERSALAAALWPEQVKVQAAIAEAVSGYGTFSGARAGAGFVVPWNSLDQLLNAHIMNAREAGDEQLVELYRQQGMGLAARLKAMAIRAREAGGEGAATAARALARTDQPRSLSESTIAIGSELESLRNDLPQSATSRTALSSLVQASSRFGELVDRLQDPGDPVWRVVTNEGNDKHWNTVFGENYFHAQGDSSVVIVRDSPMSFRMQEVTNDPQALVRAQLDIARSVTDAALSVAGAVSGIPTGALASSASGRSTDDAISSVGNDGLAQRRATAEARQRSRERAVNNLQSSLRAMESDLSSMGGGDKEQPQVDVQTERLLSVLKGHRPIFAPPEGN